MTSPCLLCIFDSRLLPTLRGFCCAECPERIPALGFQCCAPQPAEVHDVVRRHYNTVYHAIPENHYVKAEDAGKLGEA
jgi:hypothetical protein